MHPPEVDRALSAELAACEEAIAGNPECVRLWEKAEKLYQQASHNASCVTEAHTYCELAREARETVREYTYDLH